MPQPLESPTAQDLAHGSEGGSEPTMASIGGWPSVLARLAAREDLSATEAATALREILGGVATPSQMAAFIFGLRCKGETAEELSGMLEAMLEVAEIVPVPAHLAGRLVDTCGTGGDRAGTINVSTIAALIVAGADVPVCKHGGRAASSRTGSADVLEALGVEIALPPASVARCIEGAGIGFCFAPRYHPAMRHVGPTRRELGVPTAFNLLGPLANPGRARYQLVGVGDGRTAQRIAAVLGAAGAHRAWVVHGDDGLDEISTAATSSVVEWRKTGKAPEGAQAGELSTFSVDPVALGLPLARAEELRGAGPERNAEVVKSVLSGEPGPPRDIAVLNAAAALAVVGEAADLQEGLVRARESVDSGRALEALGRLVELSQAEAAEGGARP